MPVYITYDNILWNERNTILCPFGKLGMIALRKETGMGINEIESEIRRLSLSDRAALTKRIVESLDELAESEIEALWAEEAERRLEELVEQGLVAEIPSGEVLSRARAALS
jgi:hypothetical protein